MPGSLGTKLVRGVFRSWFGRSRAATEVDIVYTWVDGNDAEFQRTCRNYALASQPHAAVAEQRFRDSDELRFSLRSLESYVPWAGRVFLVTNGQVPRWLRRDHPRVRLVRHEEIFPDPSHLPTFNSAAIEAHLHRIPGISRYFLYLNDDFFFGRRISPRHYLTGDGRPRLWVDRWQLPFRYSSRDDLALQWFAYSRKLLTDALGRRRFASPAHGPILVDRDAFAEVVSQWSEEFARTSAFRFRVGRMAMPHVLYLHWLAARRGGELAVNSGKQYAFAMFQPPLSSVEAHFHSIRRSRPLCFCINDDWDGDAEVKDSRLRQFLESYFPQPSSFEVSEPDRREQAPLRARPGLDQRPNVAIS